MEKLFDERFEHEQDISRTIWYGYYEELTEETAAEIVALVENDLKVETTKKTMTHWIFYAEEQSQDALAEQVRSSLMIRENAGSFIVHYNFSDFGFVTKLDQIEEFSTELAGRLEGNK